MLVADLVRLALGGALLYFGAEWLVKGAAGLARAFGVRQVVVGLTIVAYGTSAPELVVSVFAAADGRSAIALGNVIGSNVANLGLILGLTALIRPPSVDGSLIYREVPLLIAVTLLVPAALWNDSISRLEGLLLFVGAVSFTWFTLRRTPGARGSRPDTPAPEARKTGSERARKPKLVGLTIAGLLGLAAGGRVFVQGASGLAVDLGVSERLVGLTIVAAGTSVPELAACVVAAARGHSALAVGNVVGSNIFNVLLVLGTSASVRPIAASFADNRVDLLALVVLTLASAVVLRKQRVISRPEGALLTLAYGAFIVLVIST